MELHWDIYNPESDAPAILVLGASLAGSSAVQWTQVAQRLSSAAVVAFVDLPGHALSPVWDDADAPTLEVVAAAIMDAIRAIRDQVGNKPVIFAGLSITGATALHIARDYPDELAGAVRPTHRHRGGGRAGARFRARTGTCRPAAPARGGGCGLLSLTCKEPPEAGWCFTELVNRSHR